MRNWKTFTTEELQEIRKNPYVKSATVKMIRFTVEFKDEFWRKYNEECKDAVRIMTEMGFDVSVLGETRCAGVLTHIREQVKSGEEFRDVRKVPESTDKGIEDLPPSKAILKMNHKIAYLEQQMEFIKKTINADNKARRKK